MENENMQMAIKYFKLNKGFHRFFIQLKVKYISYGDLSGKVTLKKLSKQEKEALEGFFGKNLNNDISISIKLFYETLKKTRFGELDYLQLLQGYFGKEILTKNQQDFIKQELWQSFYNDIKKNSCTTVREWLDYMNQHTDSGDYLWFKLQYNKDKEILKQLVHDLNKIVENLPNKTDELEHRAMFGARLFRNPHILDDNKPLFKILKYYLQYRFGKSLENNLIDEAEMLYKVGIVKDTVVNNTLCYKLKASYRGIEAKGWTGFSNDNQLMNITLWNLKKVDKITSNKRKVYIVENPSIFTFLISRYPDESIICTMGQFNYSAYIMLDLLVESGNHLYYAGDFDPEGLLMAQRLKTRYQDKLELITYTKENYLNYLSDVLISKKRLKQLDNLEDEKLINIGELIKIYNKATYQESLGEIIFNFMI